MKSEKIFYTIGHGNTSLEDFFSCLKKYDITHIIDVRETPFSLSSPHFNYKRFKKSCKDEGLKYLWRGNILGGDYFSPKKVLSYLLCVYKQLGSKNFEKREKYCLLGREEEPRSCHRHWCLSRIVSEHFPKKYRKNVCIKHLHPHKEIIFAWKDFSTKGTHGEVKFENLHKILVWKKMNFAF